MRVRRLDAAGDMLFGQSAANFYLDQPEAVAQVVMTRLRLNLGEWFGDLGDGTPWNTEILGNRTTATRDPALRGRVLDTPGVTEIAAYQSAFTGRTREFTAAMTLNTAYGAAVLAMLPPKAGGAPLDATGGGVGAPSYTTREIGLVDGGGATTVSMVTAKLGAASRADISDFQIVNLDLGTI